MGEIDVLGMMQMYANDAVTLASRMQSELDYSEQSLEVVEEILGKYHSSITDEVTEEQIGLMSLTWGGYIGEVMRRKFDGVWTMEKELIKLVIKGTDCYPMGAAFMRIKSGEDSSIVDYYNSIKNGLQLLC